MAGAVQSVVPMGLGSWRATIKTSLLDEVLLEVVDCYRDTHVRAMRVMPITWRLSARTRRPGAGTSAHSSGNAKRGFGDLIYESKPRKRKSNCSTWNIVSPPGKTLACSTWNILSAFGKTLACSTWNKVCA